MMFASSFTKRRPLFLKALLLSLCLHGAALLYFYTHPFLLRSPWHSLFKFTSKPPEPLPFEEDAEAIARNEALAQAFQRLFVPPSYLHKPLDAKALPQGISLSPTVEAAEEAICLQTEEVFPLVLGEVKSEPPLVATPFVPEEERGHLPPLLEKPPLLIEPFQPLHLDRTPPQVSPLLSDLPNLTDRDLISWQSHQEPQLTPIEESRDSLEKAPVLSLRIEEKSTLRSEPPTFSAEQLSSAQIPLPIYIPHQSPSLPIREEIPQIEAYALPELAMGEDWHHKFDVDLQFTPEKGGSGYLFSIDISPKAGAESNALQQNFYFILDRSHAIQRHKFAVFKRAILKALASMQPGETFNIYFLDRKGIKMSSHPLPYSAESVRAAEEFLERQEIGTPFVSSSLYGALESVLSDISPSPQSVHTAIILTDGHTSLKPAEEQKALKRWIQTNHGRLSVHTAAVGQKNNLVALDLLSTASGGKLLYSDTHASFPRKLGKLILDLHDPLIYDLSIALLPSDENATITLSQASSHLPNVYSHNSYRLVGRIDLPCDFDLILKGRNEREWITLEKRISFSEGERVPSAVGPMKDRFQMHLLYAKFLREGGMKPLKEATEILKKSHDPIAFE